MGWTSGQGESSVHDISSQVQMHRNNRAKNIKHHPASVKSGLIPQPAGPNF